MKKFCEFLREIINFEKKKLLQIKSPNHTLVKNAATFAEKKLKKKMMVIKKNCKDRSGCHNTGKYRGGAHSICNLKYSAPKKIPVVFYSGSNYDYHFIMTELAKEFGGEFSHLGESERNS